MRFRPGCGPGIPARFARYSARRSGEPMTRALADGQRRVLADPQAQTGQDPAGVGTDQPRPRRRFLTRLGIRSGTDKEGRCGRKRGSTTHPRAAHALAIGLACLALGVAGFFTGASVLWFSSGPLPDLVRTAIGLAALVAARHAPTAEFLGAAPMVVLAGLPAVRDRGRRAGRPAGARGRVLAALGRHHPARRDHAGRGGDGAVSPAAPGRGAVAGQVRRAPGTVSHRRSPGGHGRLRIPRKGLPSR